MHTYRSYSGIAAVILSGIALISYSLGRLTMPSALSLSSIQDVTGGMDLYCVNVVDDPAGTDCDECTSNGNGGSFKCFATGVNQTGEYQPGMNPANMISFNQSECGGTGRHYYNGDCTDPYLLYSECLRVITVAGTPVYPPGVVCD